MEVGKTATKNVQGPRTGKDLLNITNGFSPLGDQGNILQQHPGGTNDKGKCSKRSGFGSTEIPTILT